MAGAGSDAALDDGHGNAGFSGNDTAFTTIPIEAPFGSSDCYYDTEEDSAGLEDMYTLDKAVLSEKTLHLIWAKCAKFLRSCAAYTRLWTFYLVILYVLFSIVLVIFQHYFVYLRYYPPTSRHLVEEPGTDLLAMTDFRDLYFWSKDSSTRLHAYLFLQRRSDQNQSIIRSTSIAITGGRAINEEESEALKGVPTILLSHGTGGNIGHRVQHISKLLPVCACNIFLISYRGYGKSDGSPDKAGLQQDMQGGLDYLLNHAGVDPTRIVLFGQSLGGALAIDLAARNLYKIRALIVENTFCSLKRLIKEVTPRIFHWLIRFFTEDWDSLSAIKMMQECGALPAILFMSGDQDELIGKAHMLELYEAARKPPSSNALHKSISNVREIAHFPNGTHMCTFKEPGFYDILGQFVKKYGTK